MINIRLFYVEHTDLGQMSQTRTAPCTWVHVCPQQGSGCFCPAARHNSSMKWLCRSGTDYTREYDPLTPYFSRNFSSMTADTSSNGLPMPRIDLTSPVILAKRCKCGSSYKKETQSASTVTMCISRDAGCNEIDHDASRRCGRAIEESTTELVPCMGVAYRGLPTKPPSNADVTDV